MLKVNKRSRKQLPRLQIHPRQNFIDQQNALKPSCHRIHHLKTPQHDPVTMFSHQLNTPKPIANPEFENSSRSTMLLQFPIGKHLRRSQIANILSPKNIVQSGNYQDDVQVSEPLASLNKGVLMPSNINFRQTKRAFVNSSALSIKSVKKSALEQECSIFVNRKANFVQRKDVRSRMIKYMKDMQFRSKNGNTDRTSYREYSGIQDIIESKYTIPIKKKQRMNEEKIEGWNNKNTQYLYQGEGFLESIINSHRD